MPDKRIIPFCTFNVMPKFYRDEVQNKFSIPSEVWERRNKSKLSEDIYKRNVAALKSGNPYKKTYHNMTNYFETTKKLRGGKRKPSNLKIRGITLPIKGQPALASLISRGNKGKS